MINKPVGCLFPMCDCKNNRLGCAYEPYDLKNPWNNLYENSKSLFSEFEEFYDSFDEILGG